MKYNVSVSSSSNIDVTVKNYRIKKSVDVDTNIDVNVTAVEELSDLSDVNPADKSNNYLLMWDATTQKHVYVSPSEILDRADGVNDDALDYGSY